MAVLRHLEVLSPGHAPATAAAACADAGSAAMAVWCGARILPLERRVYSITLVVGLFLYPVKLLNIYFKLLPYLPVKSTGRTACSIKYNFVMSL